MTLYRVFLHLPYTFNATAKNNGAQERALCPVSSEIPPIARSTDDCWDTIALADNIFSCFVFGLFTRFSALLTAGSVLRLSQSPSTG
jgi:hypothetical protein